MKKKPISRLNAEVILAFADGNMSATAGGKIMCMSPNTVDYHIRKVKELTGLDAKKFYDLARLVIMARKIVGGIDDGQT